MIVVTTPTGRIGHQILAHLLDGDEPIRIIARDPSRIDPDVRRRVEVVEGSHSDPAVLDRALAGVGSLFWLIPPGVGMEDARAQYLSFAHPACEAVRSHGVAHVVSVTSAGHGWPKSAGLLSAAFAMDAEIERSGASYRALSAPWFMENLLRETDAIHERGTFAMAYERDRSLASVATQDIAAAGATFLADRSWDGQEYLPIFGPDNINPTEMAEVISDVLGRTVTYTELNLADVASAMAQRGVSENRVRDMVEMISAQNEGIYDNDQAAAETGATSFRTWCQTILQPAVLRAAK